MPPSHPIIIPTLPSHAEVWPSSASKSQDACRASREQFFPTPPDSWTERELASLLTRLSRHVPSADAEEQTIVDDTFTCAHPFDQDAIRTKGNGARVSDFREDFCAKVMVLILGLCIMCVVLITVARGSHESALNTTRTLHPKIALSSHSGRTPLSYEWTGGDVPAVSPAQAPSAASSKHADATAAAKDDAWTVTQATDMRLVPPSHALPRKKGLTTAPTKQTGDIAALAAAAKQAKKETTAAALAQARADKDAAAAAAAKQARADTALAAAAQQAKDDADDAALKATAQQARDVTEAAHQAKHIAEHARVTAKAAELDVKRADKDVAAAVANRARDDAADWCTHCGLTAD